MAYTRGEVYAWDDGERIHIWVENGDDGCLDSVWAENHANPAGVALPMKRFDELVAMRHADLVESGKLREAQQRALRRHGGNGGAEALQRLIGQDREGEMTETTATTADGQMVLQFGHDIRLTAFRYRHNPGGELAIRQQMGDGMLTGYMFELSDEQCRALVEALREDDDAE